MNCSNCNRQLGCKCQLRTTSDGTKCCSYCISTYESSKRGEIPRPGPVTYPPGPFRPKVNYTSLKI